MRQELIDEIKKEMRHLPLLIFKDLYFFFQLTEKLSFFLQREPLLMVNVHPLRLLDHTATFLRKKTSFINTMISNTACSFEKHQKSSIFLCSRPKMAVFQIFQDRFFHGPLISIREGLLRVFIQVPPLFASKNHLSVL